MDRQEYMNLRSKNSFGIIFEYYNEFFDPAKQEIKLSYNELYQLLQVCGYNIGAVLEKCINFYDDKYNVIAIKDKNNNLLRVI